MHWYILKRLAIVPLMLFLFSVIAFALIQAPPGDFLTSYIAELAQGGSSLDQAQIDALRRQYGLDRPIYEQYFLWVGSLLKGDLGISLEWRRSNAELIGERLLLTLALTTGSLIFTWLVAIPIGIVSATRQYSWIDNSSTVGAFIGLAIPQFWFALLLQLFFAVQLGWLPTSTQGQDAEGLAKAKYYIMPTVVLAVPLIATFARFMRSSMLEVIRQDYINTARAKGLTERNVLYNHALRNALIPMVTIIGLQLPRMLSGGVIVETIFAWPGLGQLGYQSILNRDYPIILALTVISGAFLLVLNIVVDVIYVLVDPRIAYDSESQ